MTAATGCDCAADVDDCVPGCDCMCHTWCDEDCCCDARNPQ